MPAGGEVLLLSGWSDGPLPYIHQTTGGRYVPLQMPPCGLRWCWNPFTLLLVGVIVAVYVGCDHAMELTSAAARGGAVVGILAAGCVAGRLCVAGIVRFAMWRGVQDVLSVEPKLIIGFSWGGGVLHDVLASYDGPALLLAPTSILMQKAALRRRSSFRNPRKVVVVCASSDEFCPPETAALYERLGCQVHRVQDNHVLCRRSTLDLIMDTVDELLTAP